MLCILPYSGSYHRVTQKIESELSTPMSGIDFW